MASSLPEHYCTLFDSKFLPQGLALHASLKRWAGSFRLWILCMDEEVESQLRRLALPDVSLIPLREIETPELLAVKPGRTRGEYCWTLTPFIFPAVFARDASAARATYLDADMYFFAPPSLLLGELDANGKQVLLTDHAYDPEHDQSATNGRFCVQFLTFSASPESRELLRWWGDRCLEWCFNRAEDGKFGDQKYLEGWPERHGALVHVLQRTERTLAPWNFRSLGKAGADPVLYHYHSLRIVEPGKARLYDGYRLSRARRFYSTYLAALRDARKVLADAGLPFATLPDPGRDLPLFRRLKRTLAGKLRYARF